MSATDETPIRKRKRGSVAFVLLAIAALAGGLYMWRENQAVAGSPFCHQIGTPASLLEERGSSECRGRRGIEYG